MLKNPVFTLVLGLLAGLAIGWVLAEHQAVPPAPAGGAVAGGLPAAVPQPAAAGPAIAARERLRSEAARLEGLLAQNPTDYSLMVSLANLYYDAQQWPAARSWYERALELKGDDPNVLTDLAVALRALGEFELALTRLDTATALAPSHWQSVYNRVVILHFDLHRHDEARAALTRLKEMTAGQPQIPDFTKLELEVLGHEHG